MNENGALFRALVGPSERTWYASSIGMYGPVTCELCGKEWPVITETFYPTGVFLGMIFVVECCGKVVDRLYDEFGEMFAKAFLKDFAESPTDSRFSLFRSMLKEILSKIQEKAEELVHEAKAGQETLG